MRTWHISRCRRINDGVIFFYIQLDEFGHKYTPLRLSSPSRPQTNSSPSKVFSHLLYYYHSVVRTLSIYSSSKCDVCNRVLLDEDTRPYPTSPELIYLDNWNFVSFDKQLPIPPSLQPLATTILTSACMSLTILHSTYKYLPFSVCLISLSIISSRVPHVVKNDRNSFFFQGWRIFHFFIHSSINDV